MLARRKARATIVTEPNQALQRMEWLEHSAEIKENPCGTFNGIVKKSVSGPVLMVSVENPLKCFFELLMASINSGRKIKKSSGNSNAELTVLIERICALETDLQKIVDIIDEKGSFSSSDFAKIIIKKRLYVEDIDRRGSGIRSVTIYE